MNPSDLPGSQHVLSASGIETLIVDLADRIADTVSGLSPLAVVGIHRGGVHLGRRLHHRLLSHPSITSDIAFGTLDASFNRDDLGFRGSIEVFPTEINFDIEGNHILLVDDVISSGRTIRAALNSLIQLGRPEWVKLVVLVDRGCRQLPIQPDFTGRQIPAKTDEKIRVQLDPDDSSKDSIFLVARKGHDAAGEDLPQ